MIVPGAIHPITVLSAKYLCSKTAVFKNISRGIEIPTS